MWLGHDLHWDWDGESPLEDIPVIDRKKDSEWEPRQFYAHGRSFYLTLSYLASEDSFIISVMIPEGAKTASQFTTIILLGVRDDEDRMRYEGPVLSIEELSDMNDNKAISKY